MSSKKGSEEKTGAQSRPSGQPDPALNDLEAHISQRINQLQDDGSNGSTDVTSEFESGIMPAFEPFEGYHLAALHGAEAGFTGGYEKVREGYQESGEIIKSIHNLNDQLTESLLNLNVRLNDLEERLRDIAAGQNAEIQKVRLQIKEVHKAIPSAESLTRPQAEPTQQQGKDHPVADYMNELQKQLTFLKERMDRNVTDMSSKTEERQTAFLNMLDTRVKVMEKISVGFKESLNKNFFNLAVLLVIIVLVAGVLIGGSVDRMSGFVSQQLDALRSAVRESIEATGHTPPSNLH